jgi:hypothetical protein
MVIGFEIDGIRPMRPLNRPKNLYVSLVTVKNSNFSMQLVLFLSMHSASYTANPFMTLSSTEI